MKKIIIYYPYEYRENEYTGSGVRPLNILKAFKKYCDKNELELIFISGTQQERYEAYKQIVKIPVKEITMVYAELPNIPLVLSDDNHIPSKIGADKIFFSYLKKNAIPLGAFYRDIYWMFNDLFPVRGIKGRLLTYLHGKNLSFLKKYLDVFFLPSKAMNAYVGAEKYVSLPSGGLAHDFILPEKKSKEEIDAIYVGTLHENANIPEMLKSFEIVNENEINCKLTLVCREAEFKSKREMFIDYFKAEWLEIKHLSSSELKDDYLKADFSILPYKKNIYNDFAMPVKVFEYLSYGLPIMSTNNQEVENLITKNKFGLTASDNAESYADTIIEMIKQIKLGELNKQSVLNGFLENHTWEKRVEQIVKTLTFEKG